MNEELNEFKDIIKMIEVVPKVQPPERFTEEVMLAVMQMRESVFVRVRNFFLQPREFKPAPIRALNTNISYNDISLYFILVAFAHLILAVVLFLGLKNMEGRIFVPSFLLVQSWISLFLAGWLAFWGFLLKGNSKLSTRRAQFAALVYIEVVVISGVLLLIEFKSLLFLVPFLAAMIGLSIAAGIFLAVVCGKGTFRITGTQFLI
jgi:hypothetical protein